MGRKRNGIVIIHTDGSSLNDGRGGWAWKIEFRGMLYTGMGSMTSCSNSGISELMGVIDSLSHLDSILKDYPDAAHEVQIYLDNKYIVDAFNNGRVDKWLSNNFAEARMPDLWRKLVRNLPDIQTHFHWIPGHSGHPDNNYVDKQARWAANYAGHEATKVFVRDDSQDEFEWNNRWSEGADDVTNVATATATEDQSPSLADLEVTNIFDKPKVKASKIKLSGSQNLAWGGQESKLDASMTKARAKLQDVHCHFSDSPSVREKKRRAKSQKEDGKVHHRSRKPQKPAP